MPEWSRPVPTDENVRGAEVNAASRGALVFTLLLVASFLAVAPLVGSPATVRLSAVLVSAAVVAFLIRQPWLWQESHLEGIAR